VYAQCDSDNGKSYKYVLITTNQPDTKSNPIPNPTTKQDSVTVFSETSEDPSL